MTDLIVETAPWPPAEDAGWNQAYSTDVPADPFERYEWLNGRVEEMWQHRRYRDVLPVCLEALDVLPKLGTDEWDIRETSAFGYATLLMGVLGDQEGLARLRSHPSAGGRGCPRTTRRRRSPGARWRSPGRPGPRHRRGRARRGRESGSASPGRPVQPL